MKILYLRKRIKKDEKFGLKKMEQNRKEKYF